MNCVLLGYGTVGKEIERLCQSLDDLNIQHVFVRPSKVNLPYFTDQGKTIVSAKQTDIVFECLNGLEPANTLIQIALRHGKHVISSNKAVISKYLNTYLDLAKNYGGSIQIEATVGGGIPIIDAILKLGLAEPLTQVEGILNGTSNYILTSMEQNGVSFANALSHAQSLGFAEADPTNDVEGIDVYYKSLILASLLTHSSIIDLPKPFGIANIDKIDIELAKSANRTIRHVATIKNENGKHSALIAPMFLSADSFFASVQQNYNAQLVYGSSFEKLGYYGQGAGGSATAQALVANALDVVQGRIRKIEFNRHSDFDASLICKDWIVRTTNDIDLRQFKHLEQATHLFPDPELNQALANLDAEMRKMYWFIPNKSQEEIRVINEQDKKAMIGVYQAK